MDKCQRCGQYHIKKKTEDKVDKWWSRIWRTMSTVWFIAALPNPLTKPYFYIWIMVGILVMAMGMDLLEAKLKTNWFQKVQKKLQ